MMNQKLAQMLLYVASRLADDPRNGKTKLHKIMFYSDFEAFRSTGKSISGEDYVKYDRGPFLAAIEPTVKKLSAQRKAAWAPPNEYKEVKLLPVGEVETSLLSEGERQIIEVAIKRFWGWTADAISNQSHQLFGWKTTPNNNAIPYNSAYVGEPRPLNSHETAWALNLIGRYRETKDKKAEYRP
jgi:hypothetical protein